MGRASRSLALALFCFSVFALGSIARAETTPAPELEGILQKIESRHFRWIAIRAEILFFFAGSGNASAMCAGELLYQRLDERMILLCANTQKELVFIFRTFDRRFDLYLPAQNTVYHGSIFDLEDSPDIESHLKARDLYRALKPLAIDPRRTKVERSNSLVTQLDVYNPGDPNETLARRLYLTPEGDVRGEIYYGAKGRSVTEIQRYDFKEFRGRSGAYDSILFPKKITIISPETQKGSAIFFTKVEALDTVDPLDFILRVPPGTKEVFMEEKNPRFQELKEPAAAPAPVSPVKAMPVYFAKAREVPEEKTTPAPERDEKETVPTPASVSSPILPAPPVKEMTEQTGPAPLENTSAIDNLSSATNSQTTLDPSVDPSLEMEKQ